MNLINNKRVVRKWLARMSKIYMRQYLYSTHNTEMTIHFPSDRFFSIHIDTTSMELSILYLKGLPVIIPIKLCISVPDDLFFLYQQTVPTLIKCRCMWHFIWVVTVCQSTCLLISRLKWDKSSAVARN